MWGANHFEIMRKSVSRQVTRQIGREKCRVGHETCQDTNEAEVSTRDSDMERLSTSIA